MTNLQYVGFPSGQSQVVQYINQQKNSRSKAVAARMRTRAVEKVKHKGNLGRVERFGCPKFACRLMLRALRMVL